MHSQMKQAAQIPTDCRGATNAIKRLLALVLFVR